MKQIFNVMDSPGGVRALVSAMASRDGLRVKPQVSGNLLDVPGVMDTLMPPDSEMESARHRRCCVLNAWNMAVEEIGEVMKWNHDGDIEAEFMERFRLCFLYLGNTMDDIMQDPAFFYGEI